LHAPAPLDEWQHHSSEDQGMTHSLKLRRRFDPPPGRLAVLAALAFAASVVATFAAADQPAWVLEAIRVFG